MAVSGDGNFDFNSIWLRRRRRRTLRGNFQLLYKPFYDGNGVDTYTSIWKDWFFEPVVNIVITANSGTFVITGTDATLTKAGGGTVMAADSGSFTLTGTVTDLLLARKLTSNSGSFALTGTAATILLARSLVLDNGGVGIYGTATTLTYDEAYRLIAESGVFSISSEDEVRFKYKGPREHSGPRSIIDFSRENTGNTRELSLRQQA